MKRLIGLALLLTSFYSCAATEARDGTSSERPMSFGAELQVYPAGVIVTGHARHTISETDSLYLRAGYNITDRQGFGEHENEEGDGPGLGIGWRRNVSPGADEGWLYGARMDLFFLEIDWEDPMRSNASDIVVLQPAIEGGYGWNLGGGRIELTATFGVEINIHTDGEDVGEGAIGLLGVTYMFGR